MSKTQVKLLDSDKNLGLTYLQLCINMTYA